MKKIISLIFSLVLIMFFTGCQKSQEVQNAVNPTKYTITFVAEEHGTVSPSTPQKVIQGGTITVTESPDTGYQFVNWTGTGGFIPTDEHPTLTVKNVTSNMTITAHFKQTNTCTVTFQAGDNGILEMLDGSKVKSVDVTVSSGGSVTSPTATADPGYKFKGWVRSDGTAQSGNPITVSNITEPRIYTADFYKDQTDTRKVTFIADSNGTLSGTTSFTVPFDGSVTTPPTAVGNDGYEFDKVKGWGCSDGTSHPQNPLPTINHVTEDKTYTAYFSLIPVKQYTVTFEVKEGGSVNPITQIVNEHGSASSRATPNPGYRFGGWSTGETGLTVTISDVTSNMTITANFAINTYMVQFIASDGGHLDKPSSQTVNWGDNTSPVTAIENSGYHFVNWSSGETNPILVITNVTSNMIITANFAVNPPMCESIQFDTTSSLYFDMGVDPHTLDTLLGRYGINYPQGLPIPFGPSVHISIIVTDSNTHTIAITVNNIVIQNNSDYSYSSINVRYEIYQEYVSETSLTSGSIGSYTLQPNGSQEFSLNVST